MNEGWIEAGLGEILFLKNGFAFKSTEYTHKGVAVIRISDINGGVVSPDKAVFVSERKEFDKFQVDKGDILIAMSGATTGKFGVFKGVEKAYQNQRVGNLKLRSDSTIEKKFIYFLLFSLKREIEKVAYGGAQPNISGKLIEGLKFQLPPLPEQRAIAARIEELFSELDYAITNFKSAQAKLEIYRQAVLKTAFEGGFSEGSIPFRNVELKNLVIKISDGPFGSNLKTADYTNEGVRVIRLENIGFNQFRDEYKTFVSYEKYESIKRHTVGNGDIIFSSFISEMVRAVILPKHIDKAINKADCFLVRVNELLISRKYLTFYFLTKDFYNQLVDQVHGATRPRINTTQLKSSIIPLCELIEQDFIVQEIESRLSVADKLAETIQTNLLKSESLRQSILKQAFEGKLLTEGELEACRKEADWEPAEKLLERIKGDKK